jgi:tetratricopeptide (TPR) repeat protein
LNFFLVGIHFRRRSPKSEQRLQKVIKQLTTRYPSLVGRLAAVPFFAPPVEGLMVFPSEQEPFSQEEIRHALAELGYETVVQHLSPNSQPGQSPLWIDPESLRLLESGKSFCRMGLLEEARIQLQAAIGRDSGCTEAYHYLSAVLRRQGRSKEAVQWLEQALQARPEEASIQFLYADLMHQHGRLGEAVDHLKEAIRLKPEASSPYVKLGEIFQGLGQADQARLAFEEGLARDPKSADAAAGLGALYVGEGRIGEAIDYLHQALAENSELHEARLQLGWCFFHTGRPHQAEVEFLQVARSGDSAFNLAAQFSLGRLYVHLGDHALAAELLTEVLEAQPQFAEAHHLLAQSLGNLGEHAQALTHWRQALALQPQRQQEIRPQLALCLSRLEQHQEAEELVKQSLSESGPQANLYELLGSIHMAQDHWDLALACLRKSQILQPDSAQTAFQIGWCLENLGDAAAEEAYSQALRLDPSLVEAYSGLGWLYYERQQYDVALVLFEKALDLDPNNPELADHVGWVHLVSRQPGSALRFFQKALEGEPGSHFYRTHAAAALLHLERYRDCQQVLSELSHEPLDEVMRAFTDYLQHQLSQAQGVASKAVSARRLKLLPAEFVALTSSDKSRSRASKWSEFRAKKGDTAPAQKRQSR